MFLAAKAQCERKLLYLCMCVCERECLQIKKPLSC